MTQEQFLLNLIAGVTIKRMFNSLCLIFMENVSCLKGKYLFLLSNENLLI